MKKDIITDKFFRGIHPADWRAVQEEMRYWYNRFDYTYPEWCRLCKAEYIRGINQ
jgi:hypothetical protein